MFHGVDPAVADLLPGEVVAIDGKTVRRSHDKRAGKGAIHLVSAWASVNTLTLGQGEDGGEVQRNHRHTQAAGNAGTERVHRNHRRHGLPEGDSRGILEGGADYLLAVKGNQGQLYQDVRDLFEGGDGLGLNGVPHDYATTLNKGHGRIERRECWSIGDPACLEYLSNAGDWSGLRSVVKVECRRETDVGATVQARYYISSLEASAHRQLAAVRAHWSIENSLHWSLDVTFREDQSRVRKDNAPQNMATLRQISHNLLKRETSLKVGIHGKRLQAG